MKGFNIKDDIMNVLEHHQAIMETLHPLFGFSYDIRSYSIKNYFLEGENESDPAYFYIEKKEELTTQVVGDFSLYFDNIGKDWLLSVNDDNVNLFEIVNSNISYKLSIYLNDSFALNEWILRVVDSSHNVDNVIVFKSRFNQITSSCFFNRNLDSAYNGDVDYCLTRKTDLFDFLVRFESLIVLFCEYQSIFRVYTFLEIITTLDNDEELDNMKIVAAMAHI